MPSVGNNVVNKKTQSLMKWSMRDTVVSAGKMNSSQTRGRRNEQLMQKPCGQRKLDSAEEIRARGCRVALESAVKHEGRGGRGKITQSLQSTCLKDFFPCCLENSWVETNMQGNTLRRLL